MEAVGHLLWPEITVWGRCWYARLLRGVDVLLPLLSQGLYPRNCYTHVR